MGADDPDEQRLLAALVEELMKKSDLCWLRLPGTDHDRVVWHIWHEGAAYVVSGGSEQPAPGLESADTATVVVRSKDSRQRMLSWRADVSTVLPGTPEWDSAVPALLAGRLNLPDLDTAAQRWTRECVVSRLVPSGVVQQPGAAPDGDLAAPPLPTPATTRRGLPRVLHRRQTRGPDLRSR